jgi:hypothetical protein
MMAAVVVEVPVEEAVEQSFQSLFKIKNSILILEFE